MIVEGTSQRFCKSMEQATAITWSPVGLIDWKLRSVHQHCMDLIDPSGGGGKVDFLKY
jgi:hypothetical protein